MTREVLERAIVIGSEASYGVDPTPAALISTIGDAPRISPVRERMPDEAVRARHDGVRHEMFDSHNDVSIETYLRGKNGTAGSPPFWSPLLLASGAEETITASTDVAYTWVTFHTMAVAPSVAIKEHVFYSDGNSRTSTALGVRGNMTITAAADSFGMVAFEGIGPFTQTEATASSGATAFSNADFDDGVTKVKIVDMVLSLDGTTTYALDSAEFSTNWTLEEDRTAKGGSSLDEVHLRRAPGENMGGSFDFKDITIFDKILADYGTDAELALILTFGGGVTLECDIQFGQYSRNGGNIGTFSVPYFAVGPCTLRFA